MLEAVKTSGCSYVIDGEDRLVDVNEGWTAFARNNQGEGVLPERVLGRSLWSYIVGMDNRLIYSRLLESIRARPRTLSLGLRCDAPALRRDLRMEIEPGAKGAVRFTLNTVRESPRPKVCLLDVDTVRGVDIVLICSWCMAVEIDLRHWIPLETAERLYVERRDKAYPRLVQTVCPACAERIARTIQR